MTKPEDRIVESYSLLVSGVLSLNRGAEEYVFHVGEPAVTCFIIKSFCDFLCTLPELF